MPPAPVAPPLLVSASPRVRLARLALEAALAVPNVLGAEAGLHGMCVTADPPAGLLRGVSVIAQADGRYAVDLCLAARIVPLVALGEEVRRRVQASVSRDGLAAQLGTVDVEFARVLTREEAQRDAEDAREQAAAAAAAAARTVVAVAPAVAPQSPGLGAGRVPGGAPTGVPRPSSPAPPGPPAPPGSSLGEAGGR